jgi:hypothetical protein
MLAKNVAQKIHIFAYTTATGAGVTGDAANITGYVSLDGVANAIDDTNPTEVDSTNMPGIYAFDLTAAETNCDSFALHATSTTGTTRIDPIIWSTIDITSSAGTAAINATASSFTKAGAEPETNTYTSTVAEDGVYHIVEDDATSTDCYYEFNVGGNGVPVSVTWLGYAQSNGDSYTVWAYNYGATAYEQIGTVTALNGTTPRTATFSMSTAHVGTGANAGKVRFRILSSDGTAFATDRLLCSYAVVAQSVGYEGGAVWIDTVNGTAGTSSYLNGTADNPVLTWADALTIASNVGLTRFEVAQGSTITLAASVDGYAFGGTDYIIDLNGQQVTNAVIAGAVVTGTATGGAGSLLMTSCKLGTVTLPEVAIIDGAFAGTITANEAGEYVFERCFSVVAGAGTPTFDFGAAVGSVNLSMRHYSGGVEIKNMGAAGTDKMSLEGHGQVVWNASCVGGNASIRGHFTITDNASGAVTVIDDARYDTTQIEDSVDASTLLGRIATSTIGTLSGAGSGTEVFVYNGVTLTATVDASGNRSVIAWS